MVNKSSNEDDSTQESTPKLNIKELSPKTSSGISKRLLTPCRQVGLSRKRKSTQIGLTPPFSTPKTTRISENEIEYNIDNTPKLKKTKISKLCNKKSKLAIEETVKIGNLQKIDVEAVELLKDSSLSNQSDNNKPKITPVVAKEEFNERNENRNTLRQNLDLFEVTSDTNEQRVIETYTSNKTSTKQKSSKNNSEGDNSFEFGNNGRVNIDKIIKSPIRPCKVIINKMKTEGKISETSKHSLQCLDDKNLLQFVSEDLVPLKRLKSRNNLLRKSPTKKKSRTEEKNNVEDDKNINDDIPVKNEQKTHIDKEFSLTKSCIKVIESKVLNKSESPSRLSDSKDDDFDFSKENIKEKIITSKNVTPKSSRVRENNKKNLIKFNKDSLKLNVQTKKSSAEKPIKRSLSASKLSQNSTSSCTEDDDDFKSNSRKTILIRKTYSKNKPHLVRAKTTGSITEKDLEEIKSRIEQKKKKIHEAEKVERKTLDELKTAIDKWRVGCQQALNELLDVMKKNAPNKQNMDIEELLHMLNIPIGLVKYNTEEFCFE